MKPHTNITYKFIDCWVGIRLQQLRRSYGYSIDIVANLINLSDDEFEKIERGNARISMPDLNTLCTFFNVKVSDFFDDAIVLLQNFNLNERDTTVSPQEGLALLRYFLNIKSPKCRQVLLEQAKLFATTNDR